MEKELTQYRPAPLSGWVKNAIGRGLETATQMAKTQYYALPYGVAAGTMAGISGMIGPQAAIPEEVFTMPGAFLYGQAAGSAIQMAKMEAGSAFNEYIKLKDENGKPMDPGAARWAALTVGVINGVIEGAQVSTVLKNIPGGEALAKRLSGDVMGKLLKIPQIRNALAKRAVEYAKDVTSETAQEVAQETITIIGGVLATVLDGGNWKFTQKNFNEDIDRLVETAKESASAFAVSMLPGAGMKAAQESRANRLEATTQNVVNEAEKILKEEAKEEASKPVGNVYIPRAAVEIYNQENPGKLEEMGVDPEQGTDSEVSMTPEQYETLTQQAPDFAESVKNDIRQGADGLTNKEAAEKTGKVIEDLTKGPDPEVEEARNVMRSIEKRSIDAGFDKELSRSFSRIVTLAAKRLAQATKRPMSDFTSFSMVKTEYKRWQQGQEEKARVRERRRAAAGPSGVLENSAEPSGSPLSRALPEATQGGVFDTTREMPQGVNDAYGDPYIGEAYKQESTQFPQTPEETYDGYYQAQEGRPNAVTELFGEFVSMMSFFETANPSSPFHEFMHHTLNIYDKLSDMNGVEEWIKQDYETILREFKTTKEKFRGDETIRKAVHEQFSKGFEVYMTTGEAPSKTLRGMFEHVRKWFIEVYGDVQRVLGVEISGELRNVYDRLLATPEEIGEEYRRRTTVTEIAMEDAAVREAIEQSEAEQRARNEDEAAWSDFDDEWLFEDLDGIALESVDGYLGYIEEEDARRTVRNEKKKVLNRISEVGRIKYDSLVREVGREKARELQKKLPQLFSKDGLGIDVLAEAAEMDTRGLIEFMEDWRTDEKKAALPLLEVNTDTLNALISRVGIEKTRKYLTERKRYLAGFQKGVQAEYELDKTNEGKRRELEDIYKEQREIDGKSTRAFKRWTGR